MTGNRRTGAVVLLSGGLDSYTAAAIARAEGYALYALTVAYGQRHAHELVAARAVARALGATHREISVDLASFGGSALVGVGEVPRDRPLDSGPQQAAPQKAAPQKAAPQKAALSRATDIPSTYVPARNTIFLALALAWAETLELLDIFLGVNALDYSGYPDCRPEFITAFERLANLATRAGVQGDRFRIHTPLIAMTKAEIVRKGTALGLDYGLTHSCYAPDEAGRPCLRCDSCRLRARGFDEAGVVDPLNPHREG